jgi:hypothetical protein
MNDEIKSVDYAAFAYACETQQACEAILSGNEQLGYIITYSVGRTGQRRSFALCKLPELSGISVRRTIECCSCKQYTRTINTTIHARARKIEPGTSYSAAAAMLAAEGYAPDVVAYALDEIVCGAPDNGPYELENGFFRLTRGESTRRLLENPPPLPDEPSDHTKFMMGAKGYLPRYHNG